jgi:hypothetical protein
MHRRIVRFLSGPPGCGWNPAVQFRAQRAERKMQSQMIGSEWRTARHPRGHPLGRGCTVVYQDPGPIQAIFSVIDGGTSLRGARADGHAEAALGLSTALRGQPLRLDGQRLRRARGQGPRSQPHVDHRRGSPATYMIAETRTTASASAARIDRWPAQTDWICDALCDLSLAMRFWT